MKLKSWIVALFNWWLYSTGFYCFIFLEIYVEGYRTPFPALDGESILRLQNNSDFYQIFTEPLLLYVEYYSIVKLSNNKIVFEYSWNFKIPDLYTAGLCSCRLWDKFLHIFILKKSYRTFLIYFAVRLIYVVSLMATSYCRLFHTVMNCP